MVFLQSQEVEPNLWGIDFHLWGTSIHYAGSIGESFYIGGEVGLLPNKFDWVLLAGKYISEENTIWSRDESEAHVNEIDQLVFGHVFTRWKPKFKWIEVEAGFRWSVYSRSGYDVDDLGLTRFLGIYSKQMVGFNKVKVGTQFSLGKMKGDYSPPDRETVVITSLLIRYNFQ
jgi:hypothetical protein